ncbi:MAG: TonB-dependent receptor [Gemmatimonadaceae bacterium]|nr:TonB-dependent receptor [Gemmatimonadaceae bacterium]
MPHVILSLLAASIPALVDSTTRVIGRVARPDGAPVDRAVVSLLEASDTTLTAADGRFVLVTTARGLVTLVVRKLGFVPATADLHLPIDTTVRLTLVPAPVIITAMRVEAAGEYRVASGSTGAMTPLDVVVTPGAAANVMRALQTLPGAQAVDEGTGLFVRGGDVTETRVLVDDAVMLSPTRLDNPTGHVTSALQPFLLSRATFSSGGFGAAYGNTLSGLVRLETAGRPTQNTATLSASIGSLSAAGAWAPRAGVGVRASAGLSNLAPLMRTFGDAQPFAPPPRGGDASIIAEIATSSSGRLRLFALRQRGEFGVGAADITGTASYRGDTREGLSVLSWRDSSTWLRPAITIGESAFDRREGVGAAGLATRLVAQHATARLTAVVSPRLSLLLGLDRERLRSRYAGDGDAALGRPGFDVSVPSDRTGGVGELTWRPVNPLQLVAGVRRDAYSLTDARTVDPRLSLAWDLAAVGLTASWGMYSQIAEPLYYRGPSSGFTPMRVEQTILGIQRGDDTTGIRIEWWHKRWFDLQQLTPDYVAVPGGRGDGRGADVQLKWRFAANVKSRLSWSTVRARRTDARSGVLAAAPADVRHSIAWITDRVYGPVTISSALRWASGRPFTDVVGATPLAGGGFDPTFGAPNAARLPNYWRSDLSASWFRPLSGGPALVVWGALANVFARDNVMRYTWTADYRERRPVLAPFNRSLYVGATLLF